MNKRIFLAIDIPKEIVPRLKQCRDRALPVTWTMPENLHITLNFLGSLEEEQIEEVCKLTEEVCKRHAPVEICFESAKAYKYMVWVKVKNNPKLSSLQIDLEAVLSQAELISDRAAKHQFHPHVCLARSKEVINGGLYPAKEISDVSFVANYIVIFESILKPDYPRYVSLDAFQLKGV